MNSKAIPCTSTHQTVLETSEVDAASQEDRGMSCNKSLKLLNVENYFHVTGRVILTFALTVKKIIMFLNITLVITSKYNFEVS